VGNYRVFDGVVFTIGLVALMNGILENDRKHRKNEGE
jgi:hypothetical protein